MNRNLFKIENVEKNSVVFTYTKKQAETNLDHLLSRFGHYVLKTSYLKIVLEIF